MIDLRRNCRRTAILLGIVFLIGFLPINLALWTGLISGLTSEKDNSFNVNYSFAISFWPTRVWVWNLRLHGRDHNVDWYVTLPRAHLAFSPRALTHKTLFVKWINASSAQLNIQEHGLPASYFIHDPWSTPGDGWPLTLEINHVVIADFNRIQFNKMEFRSTGIPSTVHGAFHLVPGHELEIKGGIWEFHNLEGASGEHPVFSSLSGKALVTAHPIATDLVGGNDVLRWFDIDLKFTGKLAQAEPFGFFRTHYNPLHIRRATGEAEGSLQIAGGILQNGSYMNAQFDPLTLKLDTHELSGVGELSWKVQQERLQMLLQLKQVKWQSSLSAPLARDGTLTVNGKSSILDLLKPFRDLELDVQLAKVKMQGIEKVIQALSGAESPAPPRALRSGEGDELTIVGRLWPNSSRFEGTLNYDLPAFVWANEDTKTQMRAHTHVAATLSSQHYDQSVFDLNRADIQLSNAAIWHEGESIYDRKAWHIGLRFNPSVIKLEPPLDLHAHFFMEMDDLKIPMRFLLPDKKFIQLVMNLFPLSHFAASGDFSYTPKKSQLHDFYAHSDHGVLKGRLASNSTDAWKGGILMELTPITGCLELNAKGADFFGSKPREHCQTLWAETPERENDWPTDPPLYVGNFLDSGAGQRMRLISNGRPLLGIRPARPEGSESNRLQR